MVQKYPKAAAAPAASLPPQRSALDRYFAISRRGSTVGAEIRGGLVTFVTMAYIIALNPLIIGTQTDVAGNLISGHAPSESGAIVTSIAMVAAATALIAGIMTILMGVYARFPIGLAAGLGINALLAYTLVRTMTWPQAMGLVVWEGVIITILVLTGFRRAVFKAVPHTLRIAISVGIGLFIAFIGLKDAGFVRSGSGTPVTLGINGNLFGWPTLVFVISLLALVILYVRKVKGSMLIAIVGTTILAIIVEAIVHNGPYNDGQTIHDTGWQLNVPAISGNIWDVPNLGLLFRVDMIGAFKGTADHTTATMALTALMAVFALLLSDFFDTLGTVFAVGSEAGLLDKTGNPPYMQQILIVDSLAAVAGGLGSTSSNTSYIESASGVGEGARTGLASVVTGVMFLVALLLAPLVKVVPSEATAPVLVLVGFLMMQQVSELDWRDLEESIPAYLTMILMPFTYSITNGIGAGFVMYALIKLVRGKGKEVHPLMWVVSVLFVLYFAQGVISRWLGLS